MLKTSREKRPTANDNSLWVNTVSNYIIAISLFSLFSMLLFLFINFKISTNGIERQTAIKVLEEVTVELGDTVILTPSTFVENTDDVDIDAVKVKSTLQKSENYTYYDTGVVVTKGKQYLDVGSYDIELLYKGETYKPILQVVDTTAPEFTNYSDTVSIEKGQAKTADQVFKVKDLSACTVVFENDTDIDFNKVGAYSTEIIAKDEYGNKTSKPLTVKIVEKGKNAQGSPSTNETVAGQTKKFATEAEVRTYGEACLRDGRATNYHYSIQSDGSYLATFG